MSELLEDWSRLDKQHKEFVLRVRNGSGGKYAAEPHFSDSDPEEQIALWEKTERLGFIECTGSYSWVTTAKYADLERELFGL